MMQAEKIAAKLARALQTRHLWHFCEEPDLEPETAELSCRKAKGDLVHYCQLGHRRLVIKLFEEYLTGSNRFLLNRRDELQLMQAAPDIAPEVHYFDLEEGFLVMSLCPGEHPSSGQLAEPGWCRHMARILAKIHRLTPRLMQMDYAARAGHYLQQLALPEAARGSTNRLLRDCRELSRCSPFVPCHQDLVHHNLLARGKNLKVLDWEYAALGHPLFDLAVITEYHGFSEAAAGRLQKAWIQEVAEDAWYKNWLGGRSFAEPARQLALAGRVYRFMDLLWQLLKDPGAIQTGLKQLNRLAEE